MKVKKLATLFAVALSLTMFGDYDTVPQLQTRPLKNIPTSTPMPTNLVPVVNRLKDNQNYLFDWTYYTDVDYKHVWLGYFPSNLNSESSINICPRWDYPSYTRGAFNINLGIDNDVCFDPSGDYNRYSVAIGTTVKIAKQHGYGFGSQINSFNANSTVIGYGASAVHDCSTVIGQGTRPNGGSSSYDKKFTSWAQADTFLKTLTANVFKGLHFEVKAGGTNTLYTITAIRSTPDENGYYYDYLETPDTGYYGDYEPGQYDWRYGKSHGKGTFTIVAVDKTLKASPGLKAVYVNDDSLYDLVTDVSGVNTVKRLTLTPTQISKGITFTKDGYDQNSAVEIGDDAIAALDQSYVSSLNSATTLRNVSVAIGARAAAVNPSNSATAQAVAIGYCANAEGGQSIAIGPGARHLTDETDMTGHNAYASGSTSIAIGYSAKATGDKTVAIGSGQGGHTLASATKSVAIGNSAQATATGAVQLGTGVNNEENTLKFQDVTIVKDGKVIGGFEESALDPKEHVLDLVNNEGEITVKTHVINTITVTNDLTASTEVGVNATGLRNYEVFIPNDEHTRPGLPFNMESELPAGITAMFRSEKTFSKFPVMITVRQPTSKYVIISAEYMDDGYTNWNPVVTNCNLVYSGSTNKKLYVRPNNKAFEGENLQCVTNVTLTFGNGADSKTRSIDYVGRVGNSFYSYGMFNEITLTSDENSYFNGASTTEKYLKVVYSTELGTFTKQFTISCDNL